MTATAQAQSPSFGRELRLVVLVCTAHFVSHYYMLMLPPLFVFIREEFSASYTELGFALTAFSLVSMTCQTPAGFLVDRVGARSVLIIGLLMSATAILVAGLAHSFWLFVAMFGLAGLGNTAYHPAEYSLLSHQISERRMGHAYSAHNFSGMLGGAVAPASLLLMYAAIGWRGAYIASAAIGFLAAAILAAAGPLDTTEPRRPAAAPASAPTPASAPGPAAAPLSGLKLLMSPVILVNWTWFALIAFINFGLQGYTAVAAQALFATPLAAGNVAMSAYLAGSAVGVLFGGFIATTIGHHALVAIACALITAIAAAVSGLVDLGSVGLIAALSTAGLAAGCSMPSRDMIVRAVTPPGSFGKVFGFLSTGFSFAGMLAPLIYGLVMDHGHPRAVFLLSAAACVAAAGAVAIGGRKAR